MATASAPGLVEVTVELKSTGAGGRRIPRRKKEEKTARGQSEGDGKEGEGGGEEGDCPDQDDSAGDFLFPPLRATLEMDVGQQPFNGYGGGPLRVLLPLRNSIHLRSALSVTGVKVLPVPSDHEDTQQQQQQSGGAGGGGAGAGGPGPGLPFGASASGGNIYMSGTIYHPPHPSSFSSSSFMFAL
jgi:hypothetical protein